MKQFSIKNIVFMALCADLGIVAKRVVSPFANILSDSLHIPGGINTAISLSFIVIGAVIVNRFGAGTIMSIVQCATALAIGFVGHLGVLSFIGYIFPGLVIDIVCQISNRFQLGRYFKIFVSSIFASISACLVSNTIVFNLQGVTFWLYLGTCSLCGAVTSLLSISIVDKLMQIYPKERPE